MSFGSKLSEVRKSKKISQAQLAKEVGTGAPVIGRYERDEAKPSIEAATKIATILECSLDYLVGTTDLEVDIATLKRMEDITKLSKDKKDYIFSLIDMALRDFKTQSAYAS